MIKQSDWLEIKRRVGRFSWQIQRKWIDLGRFIFTKVIPIAIECDWCSRLMPIEFSKLAHHLRFRGRKHTQIVLCDSCDKRESIWDSFFDDDDDDYDSDWDDDDEISETSFARYLIIMPDGRLGLSEVSGYKYSRQDWGETGDDQWTDDAYPLLRTKRPFLKALVTALRKKHIRMPVAGDPVDISGFCGDEYDDEEEPETGLKNASI